VTQTTSQQKLDPDLPKKTLRALQQEFQTEGGAFVGKSKSPRVPSLDFLLYAAREWKDQSSRRILVQTLTAMAQGDGLDKKEGGFWGPDLGDNARLARLYLDAYLATGETLFMEVAEQTLGWILRSLSDSETGAFFSKFDPKGGGVDRIVLTDANAMAVCLLLKAACILPERQKELEEAASHVLNLLETRLFDYRLGMFHALGPKGIPREPGLLSDQAWTMMAFTEAYQHFMKREYRDFADAVLKIALMSLWDRERGGFHAQEPQRGSPADLNAPLPQSSRDHEAPEGRRPLPLDANAVAFEAVWRLSEMKGIPNYGRWLEMGLKSLLPQVADRPHEAAPFARLLDIRLRGRLELDLIGHPEDPKTRSLLTQIHRHYLPRGVVSFIENDDMGFILSHRLKADRYPRVFVVVQGRTVASGDSAEEIEKVLEAAYSEIR